MFLWELYTLGEIPWADVEWSTAFITKLENGDVLKEPMFRQKLYNGKQIVGINLAISQMTPK